MDLNQAPQLEIKKLYREKAEERKLLMAERKKLRAEDVENLKENRFERSYARLYQQLLHQEKMKQILNKYKFKKWKKSRSKMQKSRYKDKRSRN